jgi:hypothetical protein
MAGMKREHHYVDVIERVLGGVQVTTRPQPGMRRTYAERTRQSWVRGRSSAEPEARSTSNDRRRGSE